MAVKRVLEQWQPLKLYFRSIFFQKRLGAVDNIHETLNDLSIFLYLTFLDYILPKVNKFNLIFQSKGPTLHLLHEKNSGRLHKSVSIFYHPGSITRSRLHLIDPRNHSHVPVNQIYFDTTLHELLNTEPYQRRNLINDIKERCKRFAIVLCDEIRSRFDFNNS